MLTLLAPLRVRAYRRLLLGYGVVALGTWIGEIALAVLVLRETGSAAAVAAVWVLGQFAPALTAPLVLARLNGMPANRALPALLVVQAGLLLAQAAAATSFAVGPLLVLAALDGVVGIPARALLKGSMVAATRPAGLLREGNSLLIAVFTFCASTGPFVAGGLVALVSPQAALLVNALALGFAAIVVAVRSELPRCAGAHSDRILACVRSGIAHVSDLRPLRRLLVLHGAVCLFGAAILPIEIVFVTDTLGANEAAYGTVLGLWGVGAVVGAGTLPLLRGGSLQTLLAGSFALLGTSYLGMGLAGTLEVVCAFSLLGGFANGIEAFATLTAMQERTPQALQARLNGLFESIAAGATGAGFLLGGLLATAASARAVYLVAAVGLLVAALGVRGTGGMRPALRPRPAATTAA